MNMIRRIATLIVPLCLVLAPFVASAKSMPPLTTPPLGGRWFSISMGDERAGFVHTTVAKVPGGYEIACDGSVKMLVLGTSREASSRETYLVNADLSLKSFAVEQTIDGSRMMLTGEATAKGVTVKVESAGSVKERRLKTRGVVYPPAVLNLYPLMRGVAPGKKYRIQMLDVEEVKIKDVTITAVGQETLPGGTESVHLRNDLYTFVDNDIWVDLAGNTIRESVRDGLIETNAETEAKARQFILDAALAKRDLILDFSLVRIDRPLEKPLQLKTLTLELAGVPDAMPLISDGRQKATRFDGGRVTFTVENPPNAVGVEAFAADAPENRKYLEPTDRILSDNGEIVAEKNKILAGEKDALKAIPLLTIWVAANVEESVVDSQTALDILRNRKGNCQSHARLYAALARAAGIPTRFVSGLVYVAGKGFLYHSWAESYAGRWVAVDPTFGQVPADVTHLKLAEGDSPGEMAAIAGIVGRVTGKIVEEKY